MAPTLELGFLRRRDAQKRIALVTLAVTLAGLAYALIARPWYQATLTVVPTKTQRGGGLGSLLGSELAGLAGLDAGAVGGSADVARIAAVLQSVAVTDAVIEEFALMERYQQKYLESARDELWRHCSVKTLPKPGLVQLACEDTDPKFVQRMLAFFAEYGNGVFRRVSVSSASEQVRFLEKRVEELRQQADQTAARMRAFQEQHQIVDLDSQAKAVVSSLALLQAQRINKQLELDYARKFASPGETTLRQLESQLNVVQDRQRDLELAPDVPAPAPNAAPRAPGKGEQRGVFPRAMEVPKLRAEFESLYRDRRVSEATLVFALERLEGARADEARDVSTFQVLDPPTVPTRKSRPRRALVVAESLLLGLLAGAGWEWWRNEGRARTAGVTRADEGRAA